MKTQIARVSTQVHSRLAVDLMFEVVAHGGANSELSRVLLSFAAWSSFSRGVSGAAEMSLHDVDSRNMVIPVAAIVKTPRDYLRIAKTARYGLERSFRLWERSLLMYCTDTRLR